MITEMTEPRQIGGQVLGDVACKILLLTVVAQLMKGSTTIDRCGTTAGAAAAVPRVH